MSPKMRHRITSLVYWSLICVLSISTHLPSTTGSLTLDINEDFPHDDEVNPCDLQNSYENPSGYCYCTPEDPDDAEDVKCGFARNPSRKEWQSMKLLHKVTSIQFMNRPEGAIREVPPANVFSGMKNLHYFTMKRGSLHSIPSNAFGNSSGVAELDLQDNGIHMLSPYAFSDMVNLTVIKLSENNLTEIGRNVFVNLPRLKELVLMKNGIQVVHDFAFKELKSLEDLVLQNNRISVVTREVFTGLGNLKHLELQDNLIEYVGDHVFAEMPRLQDLDLHGNGIVSVSPYAFAGLKQLSRLNLKDNKIVKFHPETFSHLNKIFFLDLRSNELETLHHSLIKPIYKNLMNMNMQLLVEGNRFMCDCLQWMQTLYEETESYYVKTHITETTCNLFESQARHIRVSSSSPGYSHSDGVFSDTLLSNVPEDTTTFAFERVTKILNLTEKDFSCEDDDEQNHHDSGKEVILPGNKHTILYPNDWDKNGDSSHQRDTHVGDISSEGMLLGGNHNSILNEPQATAALEGSEILRSAPQSTSSADQKVDTSRITQSPSSSSLSSKFRTCDFSAIFLSIIIARILI